MSDELEWAIIRGEDERQTATKKNSTIRIALLFGGVAVALGLFATPFLDRNSGASQSFHMLANNIDPFTTASTRNSASPQKSYTIRRSVLQKSPVAKCIIQTNGAPIGDC
ncbi:hypothetical protein [Ahrensia sp. 13_GOM-1096m]|uniref:hypothetical protein n=1 Tax=Ahrensia sp. 13_GOM-1096m TaxID=1380380 RepID=UPI00047DF947|nr:hypothetical protein [Ahrensia sp. 13_GOM-1096m]